jgi:hypothetical protein
MQIAELHLAFAVLQPENDQGDEQADAHQLPDTEDFEQPPWFIGQDQGIQHAALLRIRLVKVSEELRRD